MAETEQNWLDDALLRSQREEWGWCTRRNCTTCGCPKMRALLTGQSWSRGDRLVGLDLLTWERAQEVVEGLRHCQPHGYDEAIMWLLYEIWQRFSDRAHEELFPPLEGSMAGVILDQMRAHYARVLERQRLHNLRFGLKKKDWPE